jgi:S-formylglutathione hydrolase FrmB
LSSRFRTVEISDQAYTHEALQYVTAKSPALGHRGDLCLWAPESSRIETLLILLHGVYGSHWAWSLKGGVHRTAQRLLAAGEIAPMVIAMPSDGLQGDGSFYLTHPRGADVESWIVDEVPALARIAVPSLDDNPRISIGGLSMGGYGALRLGAKYAGRFASISAHSSITDIEQASLFAEEPLADFLSSAPREELSLLYWLRRHKDRLPNLRFDCGLSDSLLGGNRLLHHALDAEGIDHEYEEFAGGHEWPYWQQHVAGTLRFAGRPASRG